MEVAKMTIRFAYLFAGLMLITSVSAGEPAVSTAKISEVRFAAGNDAIVSAKSGIVRESKQQGVSFDMREALIDVVNGPTYVIQQATYFPRAKKLSFNSGLRFQPMSGGPLDDHDGPVELTCREGKIHVNGIRTDKSSICMGEGVRMTCNPDGTGATIDFADPSCTGAQNP